MNRFVRLLLAAWIVAVAACAQTTEKGRVMKFKQLTLEEEAVIIHKGTERPFSGAYTNHKEAGNYHCKQCNALLYRSEDKFESHCGWPSFDDEVPGAVLRLPDADGRRTEIVCATCKGHLGHVFLNEGFTEKNTRHCVNSISLTFVPRDREQTLPVDTGLQKAYFASGCFWGTEYHFMKAKGVRQTTVGFMGGKVDNPTYREVCAGGTGHVETTEVIFDPRETSYEALLKLFFETHDFTQKNGQGPDIGEQYLSVLFYETPEQKQLAEKYIAILRNKGYDVATSLRPADTFWEAEAYHQGYYQKKNGSPYCHIYKKIF